MLRLFPGSDWSEVRPKILGTVNLVRPEDVETFFASRGAREVWSKLLPYIKCAGNVMKEESQVPVLICGGGPVGLALAMEPGLRGVE
jgi:hypothetical protein